MGDIVESRAVGEFPTLIAVLVLGMNRQDGRHLEVARDQVFPRRPAEARGRPFKDKARAIRCGIAVGATGVPEPIHRPAVRPFNFAIDANEIGADAEI
jgi:hypothetical protein